jgi:hypothetical protein
LWRKGEKVPFYIGQTSNVQQRIFSHRARLKKKGEGFEDLRVLSVVPLSAANEEEKKWIAHFRSSGTLLANSNDGGAGRKRKPDMIRVNIKLHEDHKAWLEAHTEGIVLEDGSKDTLSGYLYRLIEAEIERVEAAEALAEKRAKKEKPE